MYDLPSESPEDPGLPDEFHDLQPHLLSATFRPQNYDKGAIFTGTDLNLYYDPAHLQWYKRPDWFGVVGVPRLYEGRDLRLSYVIWHEQVTPRVIVELLSPGTEQEDLGQTRRKAGHPPTKWQVYEQILAVPHYVLYDRYTRTLRAFQLENGQYQERLLSDNRIWIPELQIGLRLWHGSYDDVLEDWLRWYDANDNWILTEAEQERQRAEQAQQRAEQAQQRAEQAQQRAEQAQQRAEQAQQQVQQQQQVAEQERQRAEQEKQRADALAQRLRELGLEP
jgi:Uma2 family endonuclease